MGGIFAGNTGYPAPMAQVPANYVTVRNCNFDSLTSCIWAGGDSTQATPVGWTIQDNVFTNVVGFAGQSEGYGVMLTPASYCVVKNNKFSTVRRHAIYIASNGSYNIIDGNIITGIDNIAIQSNTGLTQGYANGNIIINNRISGFTRSIAYGYRSSIGIGCYGKFQNYLIANNSIELPLDTGIDSAGELSGSAYSDAMCVLNNYIQMDATATDGGIRFDGLQSGKCSGNRIKLNSAIYGIIVASNFSAVTSLIDISDNTIESAIASAIAFRLALTAARTIYIYNNHVSGITVTYAQHLLDTSTAGIVRTDLNHRLGVINTDADFTVNADGTKVNSDCPSILHTGALTAIRTVTLSEANVPKDCSGFKITRTGGGAFNLNIKSTTGATLKGIAINQWAQFMPNDAGIWALVAFGSL